MICYIQDIKLWITERIQSLRDGLAEGWVAAKKVCITQSHHFKLLDGSASHSLKIENIMMRAVLYWVCRL